ncbi:MAG: cystathionine beta-synthase, partial [Bacteroidota bacterium]
LPAAFDADLLRRVYDYRFELCQAADLATIPGFGGTSILLIDQEDFAPGPLPPGIDFVVASYANLGSVLYASIANGGYVADIQHVRRRESIAMTPANCLVALENMLGTAPAEPLVPSALTAAKTTVRTIISEVTATETTPLVGSSGLSVQYAIMMGLVDDARERHPGKAIKFVVPPNCYGGTNDQARRVAAAAEGVAVVDLPVDGDNDMVRSVSKVLDHLATVDAIPYIIAEIPTNPRVEVPDLEALKRTLGKARTTPDGQTAIPPVFILDQTFCPNVHFLGAQDTLSTVPAIAYASGSKFPSGGRCTAGYCVGNALATGLMEKIERHLLLCDNEATGQQYAILAEQLPSMNERIAAAYRNTREFVDFIEDVLPAAKINFVSHALATQGFTPSVFSLDLPTKGATDAEREAHKRQLNHRLIELMITQIPDESKYCVSYGQLKGCYWTIPATSTQGTTKEADKDYIARVSCSPDMDLARHKAVLRAFVEGM